MPWYDWETLGAVGALSEIDEVLSWSAGRLDVFGRGGSGDLVHVYFDGAWSKPESLGGDANTWASPIAGA